jgi:hypothetical protein
VEVDPRVCLVLCAWVWCGANPTTLWGSVASRGKPAESPRPLRLSCHEPVRSEDVWREGWGRTVRGIEIGKRSTTQRINERQTGVGGTAAQSTDRRPGRVQNRRRENLSFLKEYAPPVDPVQSLRWLSISRLMARLPASGESRKTAEGRTLRQKY